MTNPIKK